MEKIMNAYETLFVVNPTIGDDAVKATVSKFTDLIAKNGTIENISEWGKRRLAYPINDIPEGYYVLVNFKSGADFIAELERIFRIDENIMRDIVVRDEAPKKAPAAEVAVEAAAEEAKAEETVDAQ